MVWASPARLAMLYLGQSGAPVIAAQSVRVVASEPMSDTSPATVTFQASIPQTLANILLPGVAQQQQPVQQPAQTPWIASFPGGNTGIVIAGAIVVAGVLYVITRRR